MKYYAVYDTNVLVSAFLTKKKDSATVRVVEEMFSETITPLYNQEILNEYEEVLSRSKFMFSKETVRQLIEAIRRFGYEVHPTPTNEVLVDMNDLVFYEIVMEKRDEDAYLITGNLKHFPVRDYIVTPAEMIGILEGAR